MMSKAPWKLDINDPSIIYDIDDNIIAKDYTFLHVDDFEAIVNFINEHIEDQKLIRSKKKRLKYD